MIYGHGDDGYQYDIEFKANFSSNVWYEGISDGLVQHLQTALSKVANYPAPNADTLVKKIAEHHQVAPEQIIVTNGATEAFYLIAHGFHGKTAKIGFPTFSEYEDACTSHDLSIDYFERAQVLQTEFAEDIVFICNPNNPDGYSTTVDEIRSLLIRFPNTVFVIDEAYIEFTAEIESCVTLSTEFDHLIIVKSLTKVFAIPGLRLGYLICSPQLNQQLQRLKMPWNVNTLAIHAGTYIFEQYQASFPNMEMALTLSKNLQQAIDAMPMYTVIPSTTNYFLVRLETPEATALKTYLVQEHRLLIRNAANFRGLDEHYIRIASQSAEKNQRLVNALHEWSMPSSH